jgi:hypothetical protein
MYMKKRKTRVKRKLKGGDFRSVIKKIANGIGRANDFLKKTKIISKISGAASGVILMLIGFISILLKLGMEDVVG